MTVAFCSGRSSHAPDCGSDLYFSKGSPSMSNYVLLSNAIKYNCNDGNNNNDKNSISSTNNNSNNPEIAGAPPEEKYAK